MRALDSEQEARARRLHHESVVVDTLGMAGPTVCTPAILTRIEEMVAADNSPSLIVLELERLTYEAVMRSDLPGFWEGWEASGVNVSSLTVGAFGERPFTYENAIRDLALWARMFDRVGRFKKIDRADDARRARDEGRSGILLNFQNTTHIGDDLDNLEVFYDLGIRVVQLTYNERNLVGDGCTERSPGGLTHFGVSLVRAMNELGVLVDLSHCSEPTSFDAIEASTKPAAITHAFCRSISDHDRGKSDDLIRVLGESGGYFGVLLVPFFITAEPEPTLDHFMAHVDHVVELIGPEHVGIGTDWGQDFPKYLNDLLNEEMRRFGFREEHRVDWGAKLDGYEDWRDWPNITRALVTGGYSDDEITGFLGGNFLRILEEATA